MTATLNRLSTEYIWNRITTAQDLTSASVEFAFVADGTAVDYPQEAGWLAGELTQESAQWWARVLIGPDAPTASPPGLSLAPGVYGVWVRLADNPETPVRFTGTVTVT